MSEELFGQVLCLMIVAGFIIIGIIEAVKGTGGE